MEIPDAMKIARASCDRQRKKHLDERHGFPVARKDQRTDGGRLARGRGAGRAQVMSGE
jgi:hypothetical protein